ncbi:nodulin homeobox-like isoform X3 [Coffea arabica]|uniref:Nodulin homeobox-like isoform X3 n=1 Tax=Coffea arabica TaxID=13443 RepID=A0ABM4VWB6_COFAR
MRNSKEQVFCSTEPLTLSSSLRRNDSVLDFISAVKGLHKLTSQELGRLIREAENSVIHCTAENGCQVQNGKILLLQIDVDRLARHLPLHLIAALVNWRPDEALFEYLLSGFRLLHSLCDLAPRPPKIEQIFVDDTKVSEQILDLIFFVLAILATCRQEHNISDQLVHLHSTLVSSSLYLLTACVSSQWQELTQLLLQHTKVDIFMDVAFAAVQLDIQFLHTRLSAENANFHTSPNAEETLNHLCQQCEASIQFLMSCCQQKLFRERLVRNKELCGKGGVLLLAQTVLDVNVSPFFVESSAVVAAVSRMKSKVLSILLHLCEAESVSYLDEVASNPGTLNLAKSIALEVLDLLKKMFGGDSKQPIACSAKIYPKGLLQLNGMRLADIFSDDSNFRSYITTYFTEVLTTIFSLPHGEFLSSWCSSELPVWEEDATLEYDPCAAAGWALEFFSSSDLLYPCCLESTFIPCNVPRASYAHQRTSLLVKVIANLHCFVPDICKEEKDLFLNKFLQCLQSEVPKISHRISALSDAEKAIIVNRNLSSLLSHAESLIPGFLNEEDVQLLRVFISQLESHIKPALFEENRVQDDQSKGQLLPLVEASNSNNRSDDFKGNLLKTAAFNEADSFNFRENGVDKKSVDVGKRIDKVKCNGDAGQIKSDTQNFVMIEPDLSSMGGKAPTNQIVDNESTKDVSVNIQREEKMETVQNEEKHQRKRKRTIMNDKQVALIEKALVDEPDMHRNAASLQLWADKLSDLGSEVTPSQLKNWLNNRKARMARVRVLSDGDNADKQSAPVNLPPHDSPSCPAGDVKVVSTAKGNQTSGIGDAIVKACSNESSRISLAAPIEIAQSEPVNLEPGQYVLLLDQNAKVIGNGKVHQVNGNWYGYNLKDSGTFVVDIMDLSIERWAKLPYPSEFTGISYDQAEKKLGSMRVLWNSAKVSGLASR